MRSLVRLAVFFLFLSGVTFCQIFRGERESLGVPYFHVVAPGYPTEAPDSSRLDVIVKIPYDAVQFLRTEKGFEARYGISISILDEDENQIIERIIHYSVKSKEFRETISEKAFDIIKQSFFLKPGVYKCLVEIEDQDTHKSSRQSISLDLSRFQEAMALSDILLLDHKTISEDFPDGIPSIPPQITDTDTLLYIYYEARVPEEGYVLTMKTITVKDELLTEEAVRHVESGLMVKDVIVQARPATSENKIKLQLLLQHEDQESAADLLIESRWHGLTTRVSNVDNAIEQIRYIATSDEMKKMTKAKGSKKGELFREFWEQRDPTPNTPENELMDEYYRRVDYANDKFGTWQDGWKSPMGMIFILFGPPDDIEINLHARDGRSYQRWHYYVINRSFLFVDYNGFGDYELVEPYSSPYGRRY